MISSVSTRETFVHELAANDYYAVLVCQEADADLDAVRSVKFAEPTSFRSEELRSAAARQRRTPFFIVPLATEGDYALILAPPNLAYLLKESDVPFIDAVVRVDVDVLFRVAPS